MIDISSLCLNPNQSLQEAMLCINKNMKGIALVVDADRRLLYTITDGDLRRAVLSGLDLTIPLQEWSRRLPEHGNRKPVTSPLKSPKMDLLKTMRELEIRHIPLVDEDGRVAGIALMNELLEGEEPSAVAVVMAGGVGKRLYPLTKSVPKPMLPLGEKPVLEWVVEQLRRGGIKRIQVTTHYKKDMITKHFNDGKNFGVEMNYVEENHPLGTAGALSLLDENEKDGPFLVINGDILTGLDFRAMLEFHREQKAEMTVALKEHQFQVPYGVVHADGVNVTKISEKPIVRHFINAGIYLINPSVHRLIPSNTHFDMPDLIQKLISENKRIVGFPIHEYWIDIGHVEHYEQAQADLAQGKILKNNELEG